MLKKISVKQLITGMHIEKFDGNWLKHPFWKSSFLVDSDKNLIAIKDSDVTHVWIDTDKGLDLKPVEITADKEVINVKESKKEKIKKIELKDEMEVAKQTLTRAKQATIDMFQEARMGNSISSSDVGPLVEEISESVARNPSAMLSITRLKNKDDYTYLHSVAVCALMIALGKQLNYQGNIQDLGMAGLLHDVGKMSIPEEVLNKPGKLTDEEFKIIQDHPLRGWETLNSSDEGFSECVLDVCLHHHERIDGGGYPDQLALDKLSLEARMGAVCDVYDAITSDRCYKKGWEPAESLKKMAEWKDGHFDEHIFNSFVETIGIYPSGTLVK